jgi:probable addiction module antidote protein
MKIETYLYDSADYLTSDEAIAEYLRLSLESEDAREIAQALATIVRARGGVAKFASEIGLDPDALSSLLNDGDQSPAGDMLKIMQVLGAKLSSAKVA